MPAVCQALSLALGLQQGMRQSPHPLGTLGSMRGTADKGLSCNCSDECHEEKSTEQGLCAGARAKRACSWLRDKVRPSEGGCLSRDHGAVRGQKARRPGEAVFLAAGTAHAGAQDRSERGDREEG